jgi:hypothetical protein
MLIVESTRLRVALSARRSPVLHKRMQPPRERPDDDDSHAKYSFRGRFAYALVCRYCFGRPLIVSEMPGLVGIEAVHALEGFQVSGQGPSLPIRP